MMKKTVISVILILTGFICASSQSVVIGTTSTANGLSNQVISNNGTNVIWKNKVDSIWVHGDSLVWTIAGHRYASLTPSIAAVTGGTSTIASVTNNEIEIK